MSYSIIIKKLRKSKQLSQDYLATLLGVKNHSISDWETGRSEPNIEALIKLSKVFNLPVNFIVNADDTVLSPLISFEEHNKYSSFISSNPTEDEIFKILKSCNSKQIKDIHSILNTINQM